MDQRSGDGRFIGRIKIFARIFQILSCSTRELLSALNRIIQNSTSRRRSVWRNRKPRRRTGQFRGRQIAYIIYDYFRVTGAHDTVLDHADLFSIGLRKDDVQDFDTRWDEILLSVTKVPTG